VLLEALHSLAREGRLTADRAAAACGMDEATLAGVVSDAADRARSLRTAERDRVDALQAAVRDSRSRPPGSGQGDGSADGEPDGQDPGDGGEFRRAMLDASAPAPGVEEQARAWDRVGSAAAAGALVARVHRIAGQRR
jgi:hypothetical protein